VRAESLVVEDHESERRAMSQILRSEGFTVLGAEERRPRPSAIWDENIERRSSAICIWGMSAASTCFSCGRNGSRTRSSFLLTGHSSVNSAGRGDQERARFDYLTKPVNPDELILLIRRAVEGLQKDKEIDKSASASGPEILAWIRSSANQKQMKDVFRQDSSGAAPVDSTVLILGESGYR